MHKAYMVGPIWRHIPGYEQRQFCAICNADDGMSHIQTECNALSRRKVWDLARNTWPHAPELWPNITLGIILGVGTLAIPQYRPNQENPDRNPQTRPTLKQRATTRLLQIFISEAAHLVWVLRCERVIQESNIDEQEITTRWHRAINTRLTTDRINAYQAKRDYKHTKLAELTWKKVLQQNGTLPMNWFRNREVLVGMRV
jgi:hypothetical protein